MLAVGLEPAQALEQVPGQALEQAPGREQAPGLAQECYPSGAAC